MKRRATLTTAEIQAEIDRLNAQLTEQHSTAQPVHPFAKLIDQEIAQAAAPKVPQKPVQSLAALIAQEIAKSEKKPSSPVKTAVNDNYPDILNGYKSGVNLKTISTLMSEFLGVEIKYGTLRNYFLTIAAEKGDIERRERSARKVR